MHQRSRQDIGLKLQLGLPGLSNCLLLGGKKGVDMDNKALWTSDTMKTSVRLVVKVEMVCWLCGDLFGFKRTELWWGFKQTWDLTSIFQNFQNLIFCTVNYWLFLVYYRGHILFQDKRLDTGIYTYIYAHLLACNISFLFFIFCAAANERIHSIRSLNLKQISLYL